MKYEIQPRTYKEAEKLGLIVCNSSNPKYKIEVYDDDGIFLFYGGAAGYGDYPTYLKENGKAYAAERRRLYNIRHKKELEKPYSRGWVIAKLLW